MNYPDGLNSFGESPASALAGHAAVGRDEPDVTEFARRLRINAQHLAGFLEEQYERLDTAAQQCEQLFAQRQELERAQAELQQQMREWEASRAQREAELRQEQDRLIEAWKSLEGEQRRLLAGGAAPAAAQMTQPTSTPAQTSSPQQPPPDQNHDSPPATPPAPAQQPFRPDPTMPVLETDSIVLAEHANSQPPPTAATTTSSQVYPESTTERQPRQRKISREVALDQFQRLKRDIRSHSQRSRQSVNE